MDGNSIVQWRGITRICINNFRPIMQNRLKRTCKQICFSKWFYRTVNMIRRNMVIFNLKELVFCFAAIAFVITCCRALLIVLSKADGYRF